MSLCARGIKIDDTLRLPRNNLITNGAHRYSLSTTVYLFRTAEETDRWTRAATSDSKNWRNKPWRRRREVDRKHSAINHSTPHLNGIYLSSEFYCKCLASLSKSRWLWFFQVPFHSFLFAPERPGVVAVVISGKYVIIKCGGALE